MKANQMKAIVANGYGGPEVFQIQTVERPTPKANEVLVKVVAASSTRADTMMRTGKPYFGRLFTGLSKPKRPIPGTGFSGVVVAVGSDVKSFDIGDEVFGESTDIFSTNAEFIAIPESSVMVHKPESLSFAEACVFCDGHLTSYNFLKKIANVQVGQRVLINGASGSLGMAAVQIAKSLGAHVTGVCSTGNIGLVKSLGADEVIDYRKDDFTKSQKQFDIIYDTVGKSSFKACKNVLSENGQYISPVLQFGLLIDMIITSKFGSKKAKFEATGLNNEKELKKMLEGVMEIFHKGHLKTFIDRQFPLEKVGEAHKYIDLGHKRGNVVIIMDTDSEIKQRCL